MEPVLTHAFDLRIDVAEPMELGPTAHGRRRIIAITGGSFEGRGMTGRIVPGGADWQIVRADGVAELHARYTIDIAGHGLVYIVNEGYRHGPAEVMARLAAGEPINPSLYYFRTVARFETSAPECAWMMRTIFVGVGERHPDHVRLRLFEV